MWLALAMALAFDVLDSPPLVHFDLLEDGAIVVPVTVEGQGPFRFLLDTGASRSVVTESLARRVGAASGAAIMMLTPGGQRVLQPAARLGTLRIGPVRVVDLLVTRVEDDLLKAAKDVEGIVGQDILAQAAYTIDYRRRSVVWHLDGTIPAGTRLRLDMAGGRALVSLPQRSDHEAALRMIPDTGADGLVLFARAGRRLPSVTPLDIALLRTVSGHQLVRRALLDRFYAGEIEFGNVTASIVERRDTNTADGDGLLPLHMFSAVTFDVANGFLVLQR